MIRQEDATGEASRALFAEYMDLVRERLGDVLFASTDGLIEARREGSFFGEQRLPGVLAEHGRTLAPRELVAVVYREVEAWAPQLDDDVVILALRPQP